MLFYQHPHIFHYTIFKTEAKWEGDPRQISLVNLWEIWDWPICLFRNPGGIQSLEQFASVSGLSLSPPPSLSLSFSLSLWFYTCSWHEKAMQLTAYHKHECPKYVIFPSSKLPVSFVIISKRLELVSQYQCIGASLCIYWQLLSIILLGKLYFFAIAFFFRQLS